MEAGFSYYGLRKYDMENQELSFENADALNLPCYFVDDMFKKVEVLTLEDKELDNKQKEWYLVFGNHDLEVPSNLFIPQKPNTLH